MPFLKKWLDTHQVSDRDDALDAPLVYQGRNIVFVIPRGFITDYATIPWILQFFFRKRGLWDKAAILHDFLLSRLRSRKPLVNSRDCDGLFRRVLREEGVAAPKYWMMWTAVRWAALFDRTGARQPGWWRDAPLVLVWSLLALPVLLPVILGVGLAFIPYTLYLAWSYVWKWWRGLISTAF